VFSRLRLIGAVLGVALVAGGLWLFWRRTQAAAERGQPRRIAILPIENLTGRASLDWASRAMIEVAQLELGAGEEAAVFPARDAGEAAARQATDLGYGTLELDQPATGESAPRLRYAFFLENVARHAVLSQQRGAGTALNAASALAALLAGATGVRAPRPAGVRDDRTLELFSKQKYEKCTQADRQAYWCWERWAVSTFEAGKKEDALRIVAQGRALATAAPAAARARLDFAEATFRGDPALRLAALERLVQADPGSPGAITELASQFVADRRYAEAESLYRRALDANRRQSDVWNLLAYAQAWQGRFDDARKSVEEYDRLAPGDPNPADSRGEIEMLAGNLGAAQLWFLNSYHRDAKFNSGAALEKAALASYLSGNEKVAAELVGAYLADREKAGDALAAYTRARWQFLFGQSDAAQSALENAVRRGGPDAALAATRLMLVALRDGENETARRWASRVRELTPAGGNPLLAHMAALLGQGDASGVSDAADGIAGRRADAAGPVCAGPAGVGRGPERVARRSRWLCSRDAGVVPGANRQDGRCGAPGAGRLAAAGGQRTPAVRFSGLPQLAVRARRSRGRGPRCGRSAPALRPVSALCRPRPRPLRAGRKGARREPFVNACQALRVAVARVFDRGCVVRPLPPEGRRPGAASN
jgi:Flp pilus assembly protein TadD